MSRIKTLENKIDRLRQQLQPKRDRAIPCLVLSEDGNSDYPGYEARNTEQRDLARRTGLSPECYGFDPDCDGIER